MENKANGVTTPAAGATQAQGGAAPGQADQPAAAQPGVSHDPGNPAHGDGGAAPADVAAGGGRPSADPKAARLALKEQEATRKLNTERAALQQEREKIAADQKAAAEAMQAEFRANPMAFAKKYGVTYEDITKAAITEASAATPEARIAAIETERKQERDAAETARKASEQKQQAEQAQQRVVAYVDGIHGAAAKDATKYACVNALDPSYAKGLIYDVADQMAIARQKAGSRELPTAADVLDAIETYLDGEADRLSKAKAGKVAKPAPGAADGGNGAAAAEGENEAVAKMVAAQKAAAARGRPAPRNLTNTNTQAPTPKQNGSAKMTRDDAIKAAIAAGLAAAKG